MGGNAIAIPVATLQMRLEGLFSPKKSLKAIAYSVRIFRNGNMRGLQSRTLELDPHLRTKTAEYLDAASPATAHQKEEG